MGSLPADSDKKFMLIEDLYKNRVNRKDRETYRVHNGRTIEST